MPRFLRVITIVMCAVMVPLWAYIGYMKWLYTPPPDVPCTQGMTLMPGQSCYSQFLIPDGPRRRPHVGL